MSTDAVPPGRCGNQPPSLFRRPLALTCDLRAGHAGWHETDGGMSWTHGPDTEAELRATVARLEAARDEAVMYGNLYRHERNSAEASLMGSLRDVDRLTAERDALRPVVEAAKAWAAALHAAGEDDDWADEPYLSLGAALIAAVDQLTDESNVD